MLNFDIMREPLNWVIVTLMVVLGSMAMQYICVSVGDSQVTS